VYGGATALTALGMCFNKFPNGCFQVCHASIKDHSCGCRGRRRNDDDVTLMLRISSRTILACIMFERS